MIEIKQIKVEDTYKIRKQELRKNMDLSTEFAGDYDEGTFHIGLYMDKELISIVSFTLSNYKDFSGIQYQLRGMATKEEFQGKGMGKNLVAFALEVLKNKKVNVIWCHSRITAIDFYLKMGFEIVGEEFEIPPIGKHRVMFKELTPK